MCVSSNAFNYRNDEANVRGRKETTTSGAWLSLSLSIPSNTLLNLFFFLIRLLSFLLLVSLLLVLIRQFRDDDDDDDDDCDVTVVMIALSCYFICY